MNRLYKNLTTWEKTPGMKTPSKNELVRPRLSLELHHCYFLFPR